MVSLKICGKGEFWAWNEQWMCDGGWEWCAGGRWIREYDIISRVFCASPQSTLLDVCTQLRTLHNVAREKIRWFHVTHGVNWHRNDYGDDKHEISGWSALNWTIRETMTKLAKKNLHHFYFLINVLFFFSKQNVKVLWGYRQSKNISSQIVMAV